MTLGPLLVDLAGVELTAEERERLRHPQVGGVVLFSRNYTSWDQLVALVAEIHSLRETRLLVGVDQEGGRVQRLREGFTRLPAAAEFGEGYRRNRRLGLRMAEVAGWLMAAELRAAGIDFSFAPVVDLGRHAGGVVGNRAFDRDLLIVGALATAYMAGMRDAGMIPVAKHFPGLGGVDVDPQSGALGDDRDFTSIEASDLAPFAQLIGQGLPAVLVTNTLYRRASPLAVVTSSFWIGDVLRRSLGFEGAVIGDSPGPADTRSDSALQDWVANALGAGCDLLRLTGLGEQLPGILDMLGTHSNPTAQLRRVRMHGRHAVDRDRLRRGLRWREAVRLVHSIDRDPLLDMDL